MSDRKITEFRLRYEKRSISKGTNSRPSICHKSRITSCLNRSGLQTRHDLKTEMTCNKKLSNGPWPILQSLLVVRLGGVTFFLRHSSCHYPSYFLSRHSKKAIRQDKFSRSRKKKPAKFQHIRRALIFKPGG